MNKQIHHLVVASFLALAAGLTASTQIHAADAQFELVADLDPGTGPGNLFHGLPNGGSIIVGGKALFRGYDRVHGYELWGSDGTALGTEMLTDLAPGPVDGMLRVNFAMYGGLAYFVATDAGGTYHLWRTDGTAAGTEVFVDHIGFSTVVTSYGGFLWFTGWDEVHGSEPWISDGTEAGTTLLADLEPGADGSGPGGFTGVGNRVYFSAYTSDYGTELFTSDGTEAGTVQVADIEPGAGGSYPTQLTAFGNLLLMSASETTSGRELWRTDGTGIGTYLIEIRPGAEGSDPAFYGEAGGVMLIRASDGSTGRELWKTNGASALQVVDLNPGEYDGLDWTSGGIRHGDFVYFQGNDGSSGDELWRSDGTTAGTTMVADIRSGSFGSYPEPFVQMGSWLAFAADDGVHGRELWATNADGSVTQMVVDLDDASASSLNSHNVGFPGPGGTLLFPGLVDPVGRELWRSDGTAAGTLRLTDVVDPASSYPVDLTPWQGGLACQPLLGTSMGQLVTTDGTPAGTTVHDFLFGEDSREDTLVEWQGALYLSDFSTESTLTRLWKWDGSAEILLAEEGTASLLQLSTADNGVVFTKESLFLTDGTVVGTFDPLELTSTAGLNNIRLWIDGTLAYTVDYPNVTLWKTDLIADTAEQIVDPTPDDEDWTEMLGGAGGLLYFSVQDPYGAEPYERKYWASDGTAAGSEEILAFPAGAYANLVELNVQTFLLVGDYENRTWQLHATDGTAAGTSMVTSGDGDRRNRGSAVFGDDWIVFDTPEGLWLSDGTAAGTELIPNTGNYDVHQALNGWALVSGFQADRGVEFALLDPADGSMVRLPEIESGEAGTEVFNVLVSDTTLWTTALRSDVGFELFRLDLTEWLTPTTQSLFADGFESGDTSAWSSSVP